VCTENLDTTYIPWCLMHKGERPWTKEEHVVHFGHSKKKVEQAEWEGVDHSAGEVVTEVSGSGT